MDATWLFIRNATEFLIFLKVSGIAENASRFLGKLLYVFFFLVLM
jgi:hypothetical protein